jgi:CRP/FNR family transcriptional regulator, cyclic AMP receptor protein
MLSRMFDCKLIPAGTRIFAEGDRGEHVYLVQSGRVEIYKARRDGGPDLLGVIGADGIFGEMALIDDRPRMATARAVEDTVVIVIPKRIVDKKLAAADPFLVALLQIFTRNIRSLAAA